MNMKPLGLVTLGLILWPNTVSAQTNFDTPLADTSTSSDGATGVIGAKSGATPQEYTPLTASERWRLYLRSAFGPAAIARSILAGAITQGTDTPKEWGGGAKAFGERIGSSFAQHIVRKSTETAAEMALHEDNRYIRSTETGFWKRSKHAVASVFVARNEAGGEHFAYSRFGSAAGAAYISRIWQPHSTNSSGDEAVSFGLTIATDIGGNFIHEFLPSIKNGFK